jgi:hypothetical protein
MIMSPDNKTDWTCAVWLIYSQLCLQETFVFTEIILSSMEQHLTPEILTTKDLLTNPSHRLHASLHPEERQSKTVHQRDGIVDLIPLKFPLCVEYS